MEELKAAEATPPLVVRGAGAGRDEVEAVGAEVLRWLGGGGEGEGEEEVRERVEGCRGGARWSSALGGKRGEASADSLPCGDSAVEPFDGDGGGREPPMCAG
jgi:hypothetical protein